MTGTLHLVETPPGNHEQPATNENTPSTENAWLVATKMTSKSTRNATYQGQYVTTLYTDHASASAEVERLKDELKQGNITGDGNSEIDFVALNRESATYRGMKEVFDRELAYMNKRQTGYYPNKNRTAAEQINFEKDGPFMVVGGHYEPDVGKVTFNEPDIVGKFSDYHAAKTEWRSKAQATVDTCSARYLILNREDAVDAGLETMFDKTDISTSLGASAGR